MLLTRESLDPSRHPDTVAVETIFFVAFINVGNLSRVVVG